MQSVQSFVGWGHEGEGTSYIFSCFESFYCEVLRNKQKVLTKAWLQPDASGQDVTPDSFANSLLEKFQFFLEDQEQKLFGRNVAGLLETLYAEIKYVMVVLTDEVFLSLDWPGRAYWENNLLEQRIYGTHSGGQVFFQKITALLKVDDPAWHDVARVYLAALGLGFQGQYKSMDDEGAIENYSTRLFTYIHHISPRLTAMEGYALFPEASQETLSGLRGKDLPDARNWYIIFSVIGVVYLMSSYLIWYSATADITEVLDRILINATYTDTSGGA